MISPRPDDGTPQAADRERSIVWTLALATALVGLVALPKRSTHSAPAARVGDSSGARRPSPSHDGRAAHAVAQAEPERGRRATRPTEIPAKGWKDIALRTYRDIGENRIALVSAGVTFFALLAIFPAIAALVSVYGLVADASTINEQLVSLQGILPRAPSISWEIKSRP